MSETSKPTHYKDLLVWQRGMSLAKSIYMLTQEFPAEERFGLTSQIRRAAVSVPSNIAEGQARRSTREFLQFLSHADGSLAELETQLLLASQLAFIQQSEVNPILQEIQEVQKMLTGLRRRLSVGSPLATRHSPLQTKVMGQA
jgi:four helix bundle protein